MIRILAFLVAVTLGTYGLIWLADNPGEITVTWRHVEYDVPLMLGVGLVLALAIALGALWTLIRFLFRLPSLISLASRARSREKGYDALSRGMIAVGSGDARSADKHAIEARRFLASEPLTMLLRAQSAQLAGDREAAVAAFTEMLDNPRTHALGLRGLHVEARRRGDADAALAFATRAHKYAALPWAAQAVLDDYALHGEWEAALTTVESNAAAKLLDKPTANRWRAVLKTAIARQRAETDPKGALALAREASALAPTLVPAAVLSGKLTAAQGDYRRASKIIEAAYRKTPHPELAAAYVRLRHGDSVGDRLTRARAIARIVPFDLESYMTIARAAIEAKDMKAARTTLAPLIRGDGDLGRPTARVCLMMAEIEEASGDEGAVREWLNRAARAPRDRAWVADSVISDRWAPVTPAGVLDGFVWKTPDERLAPPNPLPPAPEPAQSTPIAAAIDALPPVGPSIVSATAPPPAPAEPARVSSRASGNVIMLPSTAPDDPGTHATAERKSGYRMFANE